MMHTIIVIFDSIKYIPSRVTDLEEAFKNLKFNDKYNIYYLKIETNTGEAQHDSLYKITPDTVTPFQQIKKGFDFTDATSLKMAIDYIRSGEESKYYLISLGHGSGFGFFKRDRDSRTNYEFVEGCSIPTRNPLNIDILWNREFFEAFTGINIELGIFNNCQVTLFDNCVLFSAAIKYLIATENYLSIDMLDLKEMLNDIITGTSSFDTERLGQFIYNNYIRNSLKGINIDSLNIDSTTLFYIKLERFESHFKKFEEIVYDLLELVDKDPDWVIEIQKKQDFLSASLSIIDLISFLENLLQRDLVNANTRSKIKAMLDMIDQSLISKWSCKNILKQNGIALYFPKVENFAHDKIYILYRNILCSDGKFKPTNWDKFLDKISLLGIGQTQI